MTRVILYRIGRILVCLCIICMVFYLYLPKRNNLIDNMNATVGSNHVDVLLVGSSHIEVGLNPIQMFRDYGQATYSVNIGAQTPWQSYYYIKQACRNQSPSLIILDTYMMGIVQEDNDYENYSAVNNLLDTPLSADKIEAVVNSKADSRLDILLRFPYIYSKYDLFEGFSCDKFFGLHNPSMGYHYDTDVEAYSKQIEPLRTKESVALSPRNEKFLQKIISYCNKNGIKLILINAPSMVIDNEKQKCFNYIADVAAENGIPFIDGNLYLDEIGIDWEKDTSDGGGHLNHSGVTKFTVFVENTIVKTCNLPDRRNYENYKVYYDGVEWLDEQVALGN